MNPNFDWEDRHRSDLSLVNHFGRTIQLRAPDEEMIKFVTADEEVPRKRSDTTQTNFCENCGLCELSTAPTAWPEAFQRCSACKYVWYCSKDCQAKDWPFHRLWCMKTLTSIEKKMERLGLRERHEFGASKGGKKISYSHKGDGYGEVQLHAEQCVAVYDALRLDASDPRRNRKVKVPDGRPKSGQFYKGRD